MANNLDQFFTKDKVAALCWRKTRPVLKKLLPPEEESWYFIEPSAGRGAFYDLFPAQSQKIGLDLASPRTDFLATDFLTWHPAPALAPRAHVVVMGNPPFGKKSTLAVNFFNHAAELADTVAFIVPIIFRKYFIHKLLNPEFRWIHSVEIPQNSFWTPEEPDYKINCEFQVWTRARVPP